MYYSLYNMLDFVIFVQPRMSRVLYCDFDRFIAFNIGYLENYVLEFFEKKNCMFENKKLRIARFTF
jgi:hypothetical protein